MECRTTKQRLCFLLLLFSIVAAVFPISIKAASFDEVNAPEMFLKQETNYTCTLSSAAMMMRRAALLNNDPNWRGITESSIKSIGWMEGVGLYHSFTYGYIKVNHGVLPTGNSNISQLISLLQQHPEGIVLYKSGYNMHAVLLTDYTDGTFYCADPAKGSPNGRIPLTQAYSVTATNANAYWFVSDPKVSLTPSDTTPPTIEEVKFDPHNHTELMLKVKASDSSGISEVRCNHKGAWLLETEWHLNYMVPQSNGEWHLMLRPDDGYGDYDIHLYVRDNAGNESFYATGTGFGTEEPTIKDCDVIDLDDSGFTISGEYSSGHASLEYFNIHVWTTDNGQDDICVVAPDRIDGNRFYKRIKFSEHKNERGPYNFHMYLRNKANLDGFSGINGYSPVYEAIKTIEKDGHIYALYDNALSWENAKKKAEEFGGHLATIKNQEEQTVVNELIASGNKKGYWLGGYKDNQWKWITSEDFTYDNWASTQPDNAYNREDKLMVFKEGNYEIGEWNDASNEDYIKMGFIIEYEPQLDNAVFTETLNGHTYKVYPENLTWNEAKEKCENFGGHLITANTPEEQQLVGKITSNYGSNYWLGGKLDETNVWRWVTGEVIQPQYWAPEQPDHGQGEPYLGTCTDNGLWNDYGNVFDNIDGYILELGHTNAETPKSVIHNGKEYIRYDVGLPWNEAQQYCESQGGHLAIIRDEATQQAIAELIQGGRARYLLGASDAENEGDWKWLDGSALTYTHWGNDEPNNYEDNEDYLIIDGNGDWNDVILSYSGMSTIQGFICEKNPVKKGDLNNDGRVDIMDARKDKRAAMKEVHLTGSELSAADLNGDGKVDIMEARKIKRAAMKEITLYKLL